jgi:hypothetical protein
VPWFHVIPRCICFFVKQGVGQAIACLHNAAACTQPALARMYVVLIESLLYHRVHLGVSGGRVLATDRKRLCALHTIARTVQLVLMVSAAAYLSIAG